MYLIYVLVAIAALAGIYGIYVARRNAIERENDTRAEREVRDLVDLHAKPTLWNSNDDWPSKGREAVGRSKIRGGTV